MPRIISRKQLPGFKAKEPRGGSAWRCEIDSDILKTRKSFSIYLPEDYDESDDKRYPVMYLFHPAGGTDETWFRNGLLEQIADDAFRSGMALPMLIVVPDASGEDEHHIGRHLGYFSVDGWDYEKYFIDELLPTIDQSFKTIPDKAHRAIAGVSMGGEAAVAYAQQNPSLFSAVCSISGIVGRPEQSRMAETDRAYADSLIRNNPTNFVNNATPDQIEALKTLRWYADCGDSDYFYQGNIDFFMSMKSKGIAMDFRMRSGVHGFYYWITGMPQVLSFVSLNFANPQSV